MQTLGQRLAEQREAKNYTLQDIATEIGVNRCTIQRYEKDLIKTPKLPVVTAMAKFLGVTPEWLLCESEEKYPVAAAEENIAFTYALYEEAGELNEENRAKLLEMARFFKQQQDKQ